MVPTVIAEPQHDLTLILVFRFIKDSHRLIAILVDLNCEVIQLSHRLDLDVVAPHFILPILDNVLLYARVFVSVDVLHEVLTLQVHVVHYLLSDQHMLATITIYLKCQCTIQAIPVVLHPNDPHPCLTFKLLTVSLLLDLILDLLHLISLESQFSRVEIARKSIVQF